MILHAFIAVAVILLFKYIDERKIAALCAGSLFILGPSFVLWNEKRLGLASKRVSWWGALVFLFVSALPIFILRLKYWNESFESISALGISGPQMHKISNYIFIGMLVTFFIDSFLEKKRQVDSLKHLGDHESVNQ
jgi:hypothetical protein